MRLIFDGHVDLALFALAENRDQTEELATMNAREFGLTDALHRGHAAVSLPEMRRARVAVCQSTVSARANRGARPTSRLDLDFGTQAIAYAAAQGQLAYYRILEEHGEVMLIRTAAALETHWKRWENQTGEGLPVGIMVSMECADPIVGPAQAEAWWADGVRSVMLAHFGPSHYAAGTLACGPLTAKGRDILVEFERLGMILDLTHLSEESFYDAYERFSGPVIASHTNCRALVPGDRQFTDEQIRMMIARDGVIGVALDAWMLVPGWIHGKSDPKTVSLVAVIDHIDHICQRAGNTLHAAIGTDTGGTNHMPGDFLTTVDLHKMGKLLCERGYSDEDVDNIFHGNWLRYFQKWLP